MTYTEIIHITEAEAEEFFTQTRLISDPPSGLAALVSWETGSDQLTILMVWSDASGRGDFSAERVMPLLESGKIPAGKPERIHPVHLLVRDGQTAVFS